MDNLSHPAGKRGISRAGGSSTATSGLFFAARATIRRSTPPPCQTGEATSRPVSQAGSRRPRPSSAANCGWRISARRAGTWSSSRRPTASVGLRAPSTLASRASLPRPSPCSTISSGWRSSARPRTPSSFSHPPTGSANSWTKFDTGQSSKFAPSVTAFDNQLWGGVHRRGRERRQASRIPQRERELMDQVRHWPVEQACPIRHRVRQSTRGWRSSARPRTPSSFSHPPTGARTRWTKFDTGQASQLPPSVAVIDAAASISDLGGNNQYVFWSSAPLKDLVVEIAVTKTLQVSPRSGVTPSSPVPRPVGFQINCFSPNVHETAGDKTVGWQQYGVRMWPGTKYIRRFLRELAGRPGDLSCRPLKYVPGQLAAIQWQCRHIAQRLDDPGWVDDPARVQPTGRWYGRRLQPARTDRHKD